MMKKEDFAVVVHDDDKDVVVVVDDDDKDVFIFDDGDDQEEIGDDDFNSSKIVEKKHLDQVELAPNINQLQLEEVEEVGGQVLAQPSQVLIYPINF